MGDTAPQTGEVGRLYTEAVTKDVLHGLAELAQRTHQPVLLFGFCSGAYHALQAAYRDSAVGGLILVNLQRFVWREGDPSDIVRRTDLRPTRFYLRNILSGQAWLRLLRADFDVANLVRVLVTRLLRRALAGIDPVLNLLPGSTTRVGRVRRAIQALGNRRLPILYVLGCNDPGLEELAEYFGRDGWRLRRQPNVTFRILLGADHTLGARAMRATLIQDIHAWCRASWPPRDSKLHRGSAELSPGTRAGSRLVRPQR